MLDEHRDRVESEAEHRVPDVVRGRGSGEDPHGQATTTTPTPAAYAPARRAVSRHDNPRTLPARSATKPAASASPKDCFTSSAVAARAPATTNSRSLRGSRWIAIRSTRTEADDGTAASSSAGVNTERSAYDEASTAAIPAAHGAAARPAMRTARRVDVITSSAAATAPSTRIPD